MHYIVYAPSTGEIIRSGLCPETDIPLQAVGDQIAMAADRIYSDLSYYIEQGTITERPSFNISVNGNVIRGVPSGATITIEGAEYEADGNDIEFEPSIPGIYQIALHLFPYKDHSIEVSA